MTLLAVSVGQRLDQRATTLESLDDWDFPQLADHLNRAGLKVWLQSSRKDDVFDRNAFLTTTPKDWDQLNRLGINPGPSRIQEWRGIVYCVRVGESEPAFQLWSDHSLVVGPFYFYGDAALLERIRAILVPSSPPATP
jgi:hypothetical protein